MGRLCLLLIWLTAPSVKAQLPLTQDLARRFSGVFEQTAGKGDLNCKVEPGKPFLDFAFRFESGFLVRCPLREFAGKQTTIAAVLRIHPTNRPAVTLGESLVIPAIPEQLRRRINLQHLHNEIEFSGVFVTGEGEFNVQLAVLDDAGRTRRKDWQIHAEARGNEREAKIAVNKEEVSAISYPAWEGARADAKGLRLTILMDAAPINPYSRTLRAWDRAFLLGSLSSLLRHLPVASVKLVAFNLDQQAEIFRDEDFDRSGFVGLSGALRELELGTISYKKLQRTNGWAELLSRLIEAEANSKEPSNAVIFLGPTNRLEGRVPNEWLASPQGIPLPFFYFEYYPYPGREFPDAIQHATSARGGTTYKLYSPGDLARAIGKMKAELSKSDPTLELMQ